MSQEVLDAALAGGEADLTVVGSGMKAWAHMTIEALAAIRRADKVHYVVADVMMERWLHDLNASAERLREYLPDRPRRETYALWVDAILSSVRAGQRTCAVSYGHPITLVHFSREAVRIAREEGYTAVLLPGISAEASLMCDLAVDPGPLGWQSYSAAVFLRRRPRFDTGTPLVLWQLRVATEAGPPDEIDRRGLGQLALALLEHYAPDHTVVVYEASRNPAIPPTIQSLPLARLGEARFRDSATLYVPPLAPGAAVINASQ